MSSSRRPSPRCQLVDGIPRSPYLDPTLVRQALKHRPEDGDVVLMSFPKSGTHWTQQILQLILNRGESATNFTDFVRRTPILENHGAKALENLPKPRTTRTHFQLLRANVNEKAKYVYVARNPWDACVSAYHMLKSVPKFGFQDGTFDDFFEAFMRGDYGYGEYFDHVMCGYSHRNDPNVFFFTYEQLKGDSRGVILRLAYFLGEKYGRMLEADEELFERVLKKSSFEYMKRVFGMDADEFSAALTSLEVRPGNGEVVARRNDEDKTSQLNFFRRGKVNDWKELFSEEQVKRMKARIEEMTKGSDLMSLWEKM
ncbi:hypothetical protein HPB47_004463 [Ixodes persulcatus]|uniref:Uncharacterized protein n=1 Tax=Ixodes persulcatus TaxID=34615 RepID=A0AC60PGQ4_IXOPE|nr:hypothetical protein HPB47_004463 [Ixodes persulcatus]